MHVLVVAEWNEDGVRPATLSALTFARDVASSTDGHVEMLLVGDQLAEAANDASRFGPVLIADHSALADRTADRCAPLIANVASERGVDLVVAASTSFAKDIIGRTAGLLGGSMASDIVGHSLEGDELLLQRPMYAGAVVATVSLLGSPRIVTVQASEYPPADPLAEGTADVESVVVDASTLPSLMKVEERSEAKGGRPDVTEARVVVSGGRPFKTAEDFESHVGALADALGGAAGSSRVAVDAGVAPNELQVGQTGKVVAPELYFALGISGAVQHLAGMKNAKTIVAVNNDPDAPIFEVADYGLVADVFEVVPEMIAKTRIGSSS